MKKLFLCLIVSILSYTVSAQKVIPRAEIPKMTFVMQLNVTVGPAYSIGDTPLGRRQIIPITGGTFDGPFLRGTVLSGGADYQLLSADGKRTELEAVYSIRTDDGVYIHVRNRGIMVDGTDESGGGSSFYFKAAPRFEAPADSEYAWLNNAIFVCSPSFGLKNGITLDVWKVE